MKCYPRWYLRLRRSCLTWLQGEMAAQRPTWWGSLDLQEQSPGDLAYAQAGEIGSPVVKWGIHQRFILGREGRHPPLTVRVQEIVFRLSRLRPHPEWMWSLQHGDRGRVLTRVATSTVRFVHEVLLDPPVWAEIAVLVLDKAGQVLWALVRGERIWRRYPRSLTVRLDERSYAAAQEAAKALQKVVAERDGESRPLPPEVELRVITEEMVKHEVKRLLWLNTLWLECCWKNTACPDRHMVRALIEIRVSRNQWLLAAYEVPLLELVGWTEPRKWPRRKIVLENRL